MIFKYFKIHIKILCYSFYFLNPNWILKSMNFTKISKSYVDLQIVIAQTNNTIKIYKYVHINNSGVIR